MKRLTKLADDKTYYVELGTEQTENTCPSEVIERLAVFENIYDDLIANQSKVAEEMKQLREQGKTHSCKFKELLVKKLNNSTCIDLFKFYELY